LEKLEHVRPSLASTCPFSPLTFVARSFSQPNICQFKEFFEDERIIYLILEVRLPLLPPFLPSRPSLTDRDFDSSTVRRRWEPSRIHHGEGGGRSLFVLFLPRIVRSLANSPSSLVVCSRGRSDQHYSTDLRSHGLHSSEGSHSPRSQARGESSATSKRTGRDRCR